MARYGWITRNPQKTQRSAPPFGAPSIGALDAAQRPGVTRTQPPSSAHAPASWSAVTSAPLFVGGPSSRDSLNPPRRSIPPPKRRQAARTPRRSATPQVLHKTHNTEPATKSKAVMLTALQIPGREAPPPGSAGLQSGLLHPPAAGGTFPSRCLAIHPVARGPDFPRRASSHPAAIKEDRHREA